MRIKALSKMFAAFRTKFITVKDPMKKNQLVKYYKLLIGLRQVFPLFNEDGILIALCEIWKVSEEDEALIREMKSPEKFWEGNIIYGAGVCMDPHFHKTGIYTFYIRLLRNLYKGYKIFWYNPRRKEFTKLYRM